MKKLFATFILISFLACKDSNNNKDTESNENKEEQTDKIKKSISEAKVPDIATWYKNGVNITQDNEVYDDIPVYGIARKQVEKAAYASFQNIKIFPGSRYKVSIIAKKGDVGSGFGLRIQAKFPNRVDAIFNLNEGRVENTEISGKDFAENIEASITPLENGWHNCTLTADLYNEEIRLIFGPTSSVMNPKTWESKTNEKNNMLIVPSSFKIQEF